MRPLPKGWFLLLLILPMVGFWTVGLTDLDEGFYGAVASEMLRRGEWITPYYNGSPWFEKPILLYWLAIPMLAVFGEVVGPKLPSVLCTIGTGLLIYRLVRQSLGEAPAQAAAIVSSSSILAAGVGRLMMTDAPFVLALTAAFLLHWRALDGIPHLRWAAGACLGLAVLAKGPVALILFALTLGLFTWRTPAVRPGSRGGWLGFVVAMVAVVSLWYVPCYWVNRDVFVEKFLVEQNLQRFAGGDAAHSIGGPLNWLFFFIVLVVGWAPWSFHIIQAWPRRSDLGQHRELLSLCAFWAGTVFILFSLSGSKLPHYILPMIPAVSILVGDWLGRRRPDISPRLFMVWMIAPPTLMLGFMTWALWVNYHGLFGKGPNYAELHAHARWLRTQARPTVMFQMSRRDADRGTGRPEIQETAHPSVVFYMNRVVPDFESNDQLAQFPDPSFYILTRHDRVDDALVAELQALGVSLSRAEGDVPARSYAVWIARKVKTTTP